MGEDLSGDATDMLFSGWKYAWLTNSNNRTNKATVTGAPWGKHVFKARHDEKTRESQVQGFKQDYQTIRRIAIGSDIVLDGGCSI